MPCNGMEGIDWGSVEARDAKDQIKALAKIVDQQGQDICALRTMVVYLSYASSLENPSLKPSGDIRAAARRILEREAAHAEFDRKEARP